MGLARRGEVLWEPDRALRERTALVRFERFVAERHGLEFGGDYHALWRWSVEALEDFWQAIWDFFAVHATTPPSAVLAERKMPGARWFPGARLNYADHVFRAWEGRDTATALNAYSETRPPATVTWGELRALVARIRAGLRAAGVGPGDRVCAYMPNVPEAVAAFLATASLGAVWSSAAPEFGVRAVLDRFAQIEPKVLLAIDGYRYGGRDFDRLDAVRALAENLPTLGAVYVLGYLRDGPRLADIPRARRWEELVAVEEPLACEPVAFDHPLWVLYSSGTTGLPKAIVHGHGGILLEHLKKMHLHTDLRPGDRFFWFTTTGWMMWNFLVSGLLVGATILLYEGSPAWDEMRVLWRFAQESGMTYFGTSAPFIHACMKRGLEPAASFDLSGLRGVGSTGSPLTPEGFQWVYDKVHPDVVLGSLSGGTDVCTALLMPCPLLPVHAGELQCRALGAHVQAFDEAGRPLVGQVGELVVTEPLPSMPLYFWNDPGGARYRESYFEMYPGIWRHGDWLKLTERGSAVIHGRSDSTLNRSGIRTGTSDYYRIVEQIPGIVDSLVIDTGTLGREGRLLLFVVTNPPGALNDALRSRIREALRRSLSPRHVPDEILEISAVPRTLSGKKLEVPVRRILLGTPLEAVVSPGAVANPESLDVFVAMARLGEAGRPGA